MLLRLLLVSAALTAVSLAGAAHVPFDAGTAAAWEKIRKLQTTASAMHTTAHPDDEHGGLLAMLSRGQGARVSLLTLTRGESGDNAIGPELFDAVGLIRTEELIQADRYYGVDRQYFTTLVDYGFSKRVEEAFEKWGRDAVLRDVVRVIRMDRPLVLISRFQGTPRDGHGNHQAAGAITIEAFKAAADPAAFPEQVREGLRPWQPLKLYVGGVRESEDWTIAVDTGTYDPVLGDSYQNLSRLGLAYQRSQNSGVARLAPGPAVAYYKRVASLVAAPAKESSFFDGVDVTIPGLYRALRKPAPAGAERLLTRLADEIDSVVKAFSMTDPAESAPGLARALAKARGALAELGGDADVADVLRMKEAQLEDAINAVLGIAFTAVAQPAATQVAGPLTMGPVVPGQTFEVRTSFTVRGSRGVSSVQISLGGEPGWSLQGGAVLPETAETNRPMVATFPLTVPAAAKLSKPCFSRESLQESRYTLCDPKQFGKPSTDPPVTAIASYEVDGVRVEMRVPVSRLEANLPYGNETRALAVVPAIGVSLSPASAIVPLAADSKTIEVRAELVNNRDGASDGVLSLGLPDGWSADPANHPFQFSRAGERAFVTFGVRIRSIDPREYRIDAVARSGGQDYREGYDVLQHRDLETRYLYHPASVIVRGVDVKVAPQLSVGYVMGIGDDVPRAIAQLGADVRLLASADLASADLSRFDAIVIGTRAYAVRDDLKTDNRRLLDYVRGGGHLIVLYNTQELVPRLYAPFPGELPPDAEEVSEEDSPVEILAPRDPVFATPNRITRTDFDGWVEQRGSKFWRTWDAAYSPMIATHDQGQPPQRGGWLHARYGKGHYTYFAYALHRQLPYGVPGAYRLLANLLSLGKD